MLNKIIDYIDILVARIMIWRIESGFGKESCETKDTDDFPDEPNFPRCPQCEAHEIIEWLKNYISLIEGD